MAKTPKAPKNFETAIAHLEEIVSAMESRELPLEDALDQYQNGVALLQFCQQILSNAEARIQTLHPDDAPDRRAES